MKLLRIAAITLPQLLALLVAGAYFDLLGGWNHSDSAFGCLVLLFLMAPLSTLVLLVAEGASYIRSIRQQRQQKNARRIILATVLLIEAIALDLLIISQARM
jgi:hypothetical protein